MRNKLRIAALVIILTLVGADIYILTQPSLRAPASVHKQRLNPIVRLVRNGRTFCTGTVITPNIVITAGHCTLAITPFGMGVTSMPIEIRASDNVERGTVGAVVYATPQMDQAILVGDFGIFEPKPFITDPAKLTAARIKGTVVVSCGYPLAGDLYCSTGVIVGPADFMWAIKGVLLPGMSGGPTMLADGTVVAINSAVQGDKSYVSPIYNILDSLKENKDEE